MKDNEKEKLAVAIMNLGIAFRQCGNVISELDETEVNDYICKNYPFELSFNEMILKVTEWERRVRLDLSDDFKK